MNSLQTHDAALLTETPCLIGIDEAGRGCLAGPVLAGACVLRADFFKNTSAVERSAQINDSKQLSREAREAQLAILLELQGEGLIDFEVAQGSVAEIAELNILGANRLAMQRAVEVLGARHSDLELPLLANAGPLFAEFGLVRVIVDGRPLKPWPYQHTGIVKGDGKSLSIAMASIAAKVTRDRRMLELAERYPAYGFEQHKGYATKVHREAILAHGPCPEHRELFLRKVLAPAGG
ncbi:MAG: ribonuclease HII [Coraliomargarita sp.]|nr:ribonuclease HII [Coraliomargarita sp.]